MRQKKDTDWLSNNAGLIIGAFLVVVIAMGTRELCKPKIKDVPKPVWEITAYCTCEKCCGKWADGMTASGKPAVGKIIAAPPEIPFDTRYYIEGWGWGTVQDRGGSIKGNKLDLLFPDHESALKWGRKKFQKNSNKFLQVVDK